MSSRISAAASVRLRGNPARPRAAAASASPVRRALLRGLFTTLTLIALIIVGGFLYFVARLPDPILLTLDDRPPNLTVLASDGTVLAERGLRRGYVRLDRLPAYLPTRGDRHRGPPLLQSSRRRSDRPRARQRPQSGGWHRGARRLDHHPAARQESVPEPGSHHGAEARRGHLRHLARAALHQGRDPRALSEPGLFRRRHLRGGGRGPALFRTLVAVGDAHASGTARRPAQGAVALRADAQRRAGKRPRRRGARQHGRRRIPHERRGERRGGAALAASHLRRRDGISLRRRLGGGDAARFRRQQRRRSRGRDDDRCEPPARGADDAPPDARRRRQGPRRERRRRGGARHRRRHQGVDRRPLLPHEPLRPGGEGAQATWLGLQALRLSHRARKRLYAGLGRLRLAGECGRLDAQELTTAPIAAR